MNVLLQFLQKSPDYMQLLRSVEARQAAAVSGLSQAPRSHVLAALHEHSGRPLVAVCQDDLAAGRLAAELGAFLGEQPPILPSRELTLAGAIGVSRQWEQKRLRLLYDLAQGRVPVLVASLDALLLRTMPRLFKARIEGTVFLGRIGGGAVDALLDDGETVEHLGGDIECQHGHEDDIHQIDHLLTGR